MEFLEALEKLENSEEFKKWKEKNKELYLVHGFTMLGSFKEDPMNWQIGYYDEKEDKITPIEVNGGISIGESQEAFKKNESINKLSIEKIKVSARKALDENEKARLEKYAKETPMKIFVIVQNLEEGQVWNITTATQSMNTINTKVDAETGKVKSVKTENFMQMK
ncbi:hypothetical protein KY345_04545 [Candidatus Woesearchaeota archaeon]|nr:hypothetical protein [Candidatus Woesearchaeota archaeon]